MFTVRFACFPSALEIEVHVLCFALAQTSHACVTRLNWDIVMNACIAVKISVSLMKVLKL